MTPSKSEKNNKRSSNLLKQLLKQETSNNNKASKNREKIKPTFDDEYYNAKLGGSIQINDAVKEHWAQELDEWLSSRGDEAYSVAEFYLDKGMDYEEWKRVVATNTKLKRSYTRVKQVIGILREKGVHKRKYNWDMIKSVHRRYNPEYEEEYDFMAAQDKDKGGTIVLKLDEECKGE